MHERTLVQHDRTPGRVGEQFSRLARGDVLGLARRRIRRLTGSGGDYYWGGAASTIFWVDPKEDMVVVFMTQLMPSATFNFRGQLRNIIYSAIVD